MYCKTKSRISLGLSVIILVCIHGSLSSSPGSDKFCYNKPSCGPSTWGGSCQRGNDGHQSPINVDLKKTPPAKKQSSITLSPQYSQELSKFYIQNLQTTIEISLSPKNPEIYFTSNGLNGKYIFEQLHFHWTLKNNGSGSEHSVDGKSFAMELHVVHYSNKYKSIGEAVKSGQPDALAVIGVLFDINKNQDNKFLSPIVAGIPKTKPDGSKAEVAKKLNLGNLFPNPNNQTGTRTFARYPGSLTTPPCAEIVVFTVIIDPNYISESQLKVFQDVKDGSGQAVGNNFRPTQPIGNRTIQVSSFELKK